MRQLLSDRFINCECDTRQAVRQVDRPSVSVVMDLCPDDDSKSGVRESAAKVADLADTTDQADWSFREVAPAIRPLQQSWERPKEVDFLRADGHLKQPPAGLGGRDANRAGC